MTTETALTDTDLKVAIWNAVEKWDAELENIWGIRISPKITFNLRGRTTGAIAYLADGRIDLNLDWARADLEDCLDDTVPHELCHFAAKKLFGDNGHRAGWKRTMLSIGLTPNRVAVSKKLDNVKRARKVKRFVYITSCGCECKLTNARHKLTQGTHPRKSGYYSCNKHGTRILPDDFYEQIWLD